MSRDVILRDRSSGRFHRGYRYEGQILTSEECNLDDAGTRDELDSLPPDVKMSLLCSTCFADPKEAPSEKVTA